MGRARNGEVDCPSADVGCSGAPGAKNVPLAGVLGNNRVTFGRLQPVTNRLHSHRVDSLNITKWGCIENIFLASCTSRSNGSFAYRLSQAGTCNDVHSNCWNQRRIGFHAFVRHDSPWRSGALDVEFEQPQHNLGLAGAAKRYLGFWNSYPGSKLHSHLQ